MTNSDGGKAALDAALLLLAAMKEAEPKFDSVNKATRELFGDFYPHLSPVAECVYGQLVALLNAVLGENDIADYFLHECWNGTGAAHEVDGTVWKIQTVADLRAYLNRPSATPKVTP